MARAQSEGLVNWEARVACVGGMEVWRAQKEVKVLKVLVTQSCLTRWDPMFWSPPGSSIHRVSQAGILEWVAISSNV